VATAVLVLVLLLLMFHVASAQFWSPRQSDEITYILVKLWSGGMLGNVRVLEVAVTTPQEAPITGGRLLWRFQQSFYSSLNYIIMLI
jgi:hypothetical protein